MNGKRNKSKLLVFILKINNATLLADYETRM